MSHNHTSPTSPKLEDNFPLEGNVRAKQAAKFLGISNSTFWKLVQD